MYANNLYFGWSSCTAEEMLALHKIRIMLSSNNIDKDILLDTSSQRHTMLKNSDVPISDFEDIPTMFQQYSYPGRPANYVWLSTWLFV